MRNMALLLLFTHTITSTIVGISLIGYVMLTTVPASLEPSSAS